MSRRPTRLNQTVVATRHGEELRDLTQPRNPPWLYVIPIAPAATPDDYVAGYAAYPSFVGAWANIGTDGNGFPTAPTAFRVFEGKLQLRFACTGDEAGAPSLIYTIPDGYRIDHVEPIDVVVGADKLQRGTVEVRPSGEVWFLGVTHL